MTKNTLLLRQVNPSWVQAGRMTSQTFRPTPKDEGLLSVDDGEQFTAEESFNHFTKKLSLASKGVVAVTVEECEAESVLPQSDPTPYPEHVVIDFTNHARGACEKIAKKLTAIAQNRGWQHQPVVPE